MDITFNEIPLDWRVPGVYAEFDSSRAVRGVAFQPHDALLIGQMTSAGSATEGIPRLIASSAEAIALFGAGSQLAQMVAAFKRENSLTPCYALPLSDASGTQAAGEFVYSGTSTEAGSIPHYIGGRRFVVAVPSGTDAATLETLAVAAAALQLDLPVVCTANGAGTGMVTTANHDGVIGNQIFLGVCLQDGERVPAGLTVAITAMASGATDPNYATAVTGMGEDQYATVACGASDNTNLGLVNDEMTSRWGALRAIEGVSFAARYAATRGALSTAGNAFNQQCFVLVGEKQNALSPLPWEVASQVAALSAQKAQTKPQSAMVGLVLKNAYAPPRGLRFTQNERSVLLFDGVSTLMETSDGRMAIQRLITTYQTNSLSLADTAYLDLYLVRVLAAVRYAVRTRVTTRFIGASLGSVGSIGADVINEEIIKSELLVLFKDMEALGWVENFEQFKAELLVQRSASDSNRVNIIFPPDIINAFLVGAIQIQFRR